MFFKKLFLYATILITIFSVPYLSFAQDNEAKPVSSEKFSFSFDVAVFRTQQDKALVELYYSVYRNYLKFVPEDSLLKATFVFNAEIWQDDSLITKNKWKNVNTADSLSQVDDRHKLYGIGFFSVTAGVYQLKVGLTDLNSTYSKQYEFDLPITSFPQDTLAMSDIQLASQIKKSSAATTRFSKNGYDVIPNTDRFFGTGLPMLMIYSEIYNLKKATEPDTAKYAVNYKILDGDGLVVRNFPDKVRVKPGNSAVEVSGLNIISFRSGTYFLEVTVKDLFKNESVSSKKKFFIFRQGDLAMADSSAEKLQERKLTAAYERVYKNMSKEEIDSEFGAAFYVATKEEKKIFKKLDLPGKRSFLIEFWQRRDQTPGTPLNEYRENYLKLMRTANQQFSSFGDGWKTDQGRVLLLYGAPDEIERFPYSSENKPYLIWKYFSIQGGISFYFVDKRNFGKYELVHSNARGELYDPEWERWIIPH
jgi:GWxTD domain-containing protein